MSLTIGQFRSDLPEFANPAQYPDAMIQIWLTVAITQVANTDRWGTLLTTGQELVLAHYLVLAARDQTTAAAGGAPGSVLGLQTGKTVGPISATYDYSALLVEGAAQWNQTTYGQRYFALARLVGSGGIQLGGCPGA